MRAGRKVVLLGDTCGSEAIAGMSHTHSITVTLHAERGACMGAGYLHLWPSSHDTSGLCVQRQSLMISDGQDAQSKLAELRFGRAVLEGCLSCARISAQC